MTDILYATGALHDEVGPITSFVGATKAGRRLVEAFGGTNGAYVIEDEQVPFTIDCIEGAGLTVKAA